jgi:hypothetical protein
LKHKYLTNLFGSQYNRVVTHLTGRVLNALLLLAVAANAADHGLEGTWEAQENDLPSVELTIRDNRGQIGGTIGFYFQSRGADGRWHLGDEFTVPLLSPKLDGNTLTFETIHHKRHDSQELGPNNKYRVTFVGANEARLEIVKDERQAGSARAVTLKRRVVK